MTEGSPTNMGLYKPAALIIAIVLLLGATMSRLKRPITAAPFPEDAQAAMEAM